MVVSLFQVFSSLVSPSPTDWLLGKWIGVFLVVFGVVNLVKCPVQVAFRGTIISLLTYLLKTGRAGIDYDTGTLST